MPPTKTKKTRTRSSPSKTNSPSAERELERFATFAATLVLDSGDYWELQEFQRQYVRDLFEGHREVWLVLPEGNGKTTLLAGIALYHAFSTAEAMVPIGASSRDQCQILHDQAAGFVRRSPVIRDRFRVYDGYRRIICPATGGRIQVFAADDRTGDGVIPTLCLLDELHRHRDLRLYRTWRGKLDKRGGQLTAISTAGEPNTEFEEVRSLHKAQAEEIETFPGHIRAAGAGMVLHDYHVASEDDVNDMEVVKQANPLPSITPKTLAAKHASPTISPAHWKRFVCNIATRIEGDGISPEEWDALCEEGVEPKPGAWCMGFIDLGWQIDCTALGVIAWEANERRVVGGLHIFTPPVQEKEVVEALVAVQKQFEPQAWVFDPNASGQQMAQLLDSGEHPQQAGVKFNFIEHSQDNAPMSLAAARLDEAIRNGWLVHNGDTELRAHVLNAVRRKTTAEKYRYDRPLDAKGEKRKKYPIDALTGLLMGNSVAVTEHDKPQEPIAIWGAPR